MSTESQTTRGILSHVKRFVEEIGILNFYHSSRNAKLICTGRFVRLFAYGGCTLILAAFLELLGNSTQRIGLFMTLTLIGDTLISLFLTLYADRLGRRAVLGAGALLMTLSGIVFATSENYLVLLAAAVLGVICPSGNEIGPFRAIEESTLAHLTEPERRSDIFAWYSLIGFSGAATGMLVSGWVLTALQRNGWTTLEAYKLSFYAYAAFGVIKFLFAMSMTDQVEAERKKPSDMSTETEPLLSNNTTTATPKPRKLLEYLVPQISKESTSILIKLCVLFAIDSFASGLASPSWQTFFFRDKFHLDEGILGSIFFTTTIVAALSLLVSSSIAKRIGNIKAMVFTHLPSAIALALLGIPNQLHVAVTILIVRACTQTMDTVPRSAFLSAVVLPHERTAIMGTVNVVKTCAQSVGPLITGILAHQGLLWAAFVAAGSLKVTYDLMFLAVFIGHRSREERARESESQSESERGDTIIAAHKARQNGSTKPITGT